MKIDFEKVVTQAVTTLVVGVFMGAAVIVWRGATSVDTKVQQTRSDMQHLINTLSDQLSAYQSQLTSFSNQLQQLAAHTSTVAGVQTVKRPVEAETRMMQQQYRSDIYNALQPPNAAK